MTLPHHDEACNSQGHKGDPLGLVPKIRGLVEAGNYGRRPRRADLLIP